MATSRALPPDLEAPSNASSSSSSSSTQAHFNAPPMDKAGRAEFLKIVFVIVFYFVISLSMVFLNKLVMDQLEFPYPLFLTWAQLLVQLVCVVVAGFVGQMYKPLALIPPFEFDLGIAKKVVPLTVIYLSMIVFNNLCLQYVQVSFYQVARSLTVLWTALFTKIILGKSVSYWRMIAVFVVFSGFVIGSKGERLFDWGGLIFGVVASIFVALYGIFVKRVLPAVNENEWRLLIYNTLIALVVLLPIVAFSGEGSALFGSGEEEGGLATATQDTWTAILASGLVGFLINIAIFMQIKYTSPLTNAISGTVKAAVQTLLGVLLFGNIISTLNFIGIVVVIGGSFWYSQISFRENEAEKRARLAK